MLPDYKEQGFTVSRGLLPRAMTDAVLDEYKEIFSAQLRARRLPMETFDTLQGFANNLQAIFDNSVADYIAGCKLCQHTVSVHRLSLSDELIGLLNRMGLDRPVINSRPVCHFTNNRLRIPGGYHKSPPHQDWRSMQGSLDSVVLWIPLTDVDTDGHPIEVAAGSHKLGLLETRPHPATPEVVDTRITDDSFEEVVCKVGDVVGFSSFMVHRSKADGDDSRLRMALSFRYNNLSDITFVERGYPNPYKYSYQLEIMFPDFDTGAWVKRLFS